MTSLNGSLCAYLIKYKLHNQTCASLNEGSGHHSQQHGGGHGHRFSKFTANFHHICSLLWPSSCDLIVIVMGHINVEA